MKLAIEFVEEAVHDLVRSVLFVGTLGAQVLENVLRDGFRDLERYRTLTRRRLRLGLPDWNYGGPIRTDEAKTGLTVSKIPIVCAYFHVIFTHFASLFSLSNHCFENRRA